MSAPAPASPYEQATGLLSRQAAEAAGAVTGAAGEVASQAGETAVQTIHGAFRQVLGVLEPGLRPLLEPELLVPLLQALLLLVVGLLLARAARFATRRAARSASPQQRMLLVRGVGYVVFGLFALAALDALGFQPTYLLGAAGIVTVAVGFASQTSASNLISGMFLVVERAVEVGDVITVDNVTGEVLSIDLLSTRMRTFDNLLVRVPNETMVKARITNLNRFPLRRVDVRLGVAYKEDLARVEETLRGVAHANPLCLEEPEPLIVAQGYGASSVDYLFGVWARTENFVAVKNALQREIKAAFEREGIEIPFPHVSIYAGEATAPVPLRVVPRGAPAEDGPRGALAEDGPGPDGAPEGGARDAEDDAAPGPAGGARRRATRAEAPAAAAAEESAADDDADDADADAEDGVHGERGT